jgi:hypothetical protein
MNWTEVLLAIIAAASGILAAISSWRIKEKETEIAARKTESESSREVRSGEIQVLHGSIDSLREQVANERRYFDRKLKERDVEIADIRRDLLLSKNDHTACLVRNGRLTEMCRFLLKRVGTPDELIKFDEEDREYNGKTVELPDTYPEGK